MKILSIDTGINGAYALFKNGNLVDFGKLEILKTKKKILDTSFLKNLIKGNDHILIEKAQPMPKQGISSTSRYMESFGLIQGICIGLGIPYTLISPNEWKKSILSNMPKEKCSSIVRVNQLYPDLKLGKNHHIADAILIGLYGINKIHINNVNKNV